MDVLLPLRTTGKRGHSLSGTSFVSRFAAVVFACVTRFHFPVDMLASAAFDVLYSYFRCPRSVSLRKSIAGCAVCNAKLLGDLLCRDAAIHVLP